MKRFLAYLLICLSLTACGSSPQEAQAATNAKSIEFLLSQVRNTSGSLAGGTVTAYASGTSTLKTIWLDRGKATTAANPYTLDSNGTAQLFGDGVYRILIKTSDGVTVYDRSGQSYRDASGLAYDVADYVSLAAAVASIGSTPATLQYSTDQTLAANITIPATLELMPLNGAKINHGAYTISYAGDTARWPLAQVFNGTGAVTGIVNSHTAYFGTSAAALQSALNAVPDTGGTVTLAKGTFTLGATGLTMQNKSNVTIIGAGMGNTIIDGAFVAGNVLTLGNVSGPQTLANITVKDFSIKGSATSLTDHIIGFRGIDNFTADGVEVSHGYKEGIYCDGPNPSFNRLTVKNSYFHTYYGLPGANYIIDTNTIGVGDINIHDNVFRNIAAGMLILGDRVNIHHNQFYAVANWGIKIGESNGTTARSISSCVIDGNVFYGMGKPGGPSAYTSAVGIWAGGASQMYADGTQDSGVIISNNVFKDSYADASLSLIRASGSSKVIGNYASGLITNTLSSIFIDVAFSSDVSSFVGVNTTPVKIFVEHNTLEKNPAAAYNIAYGMYVLSSNNAYLYCSSNAMDGVLEGARINATANGFLPYISLNGDILGPYNRLYDLAGTDAGLGASPLPVYGSNSTTFSTSINRDLFTNLAARNITGLTTPSVAKGEVFFTINVGPVSITNLTGGYLGAEKTIYFNDALTTVVHGSNIKLAGATNFVSTVGSTLTLWKPNIIDTAWYEKSRGKI